MEREGNALELPLRRSAAGLDRDHSERLEIDAGIALEYLENKKKAYRRLGKHDGIVNRLGVSGVGMESVEDS